MHHTALIRRQRIHGSLDNIQEEHEEESEEEVDLAEVDSGDDSKDSYLDSESTDNGSELTEVTMSNTSSSTRSGRRVPRTNGTRTFFFTKSMYVSYKTILFKQNIASRKLCDLYI